MILQVSGLTASLHQQKMKGPSRFCDVCGHMTPAPEVKCKSCPCSFHKVCLGLQPLDEVTDDWICHACKRLSIEQAKQSGESTELLHMDEVGAQEPRRESERALSSVYFDEVDTGDIPASPWSSSPRARGGEAAAREPRRERASSLLSPSLILGDKAKSSHVASKGKGKEEPVEKRKFLFSARTRWKPPDTPMQCSSCGYHEREAMNCDSCSRLFCFACMCLSAETLPANTWSCPECIGQDHYDEGRRVLIEASCRRVMEGKVTAKEQDGFSQLVFDLSCTCDWDEWEQHRRPHRPREEAAREGRGPRCHAISQPALCTQGQGRDKDGNGQIDD